MLRFIRDGERVGERRTAAEWAAIHHENKALYVAKERIANGAAPQPHTGAMPFRAAFAEWCALTPAEKGACTVMYERDFFDAMVSPRYRDYMRRDRLSANASVDDLREARTRAKGFALFSILIAAQGNPLDAWRDLTREQQDAFARRVPDVSEALFERLSLSTPGRAREPMAPKAFAVYVASPARRESAARLIQHEFIKRVMLNPRHGRTKARLEAEAERAIAELSSFATATATDTDHR